MKTKVVVDSSNPDKYAGFKDSVSRALRHFGIWYEISDLAVSGITAGELRDTHLLILAQEGIGRSLNAGESDAILKAVNNGMGLLILDGELEQYPSSLLKILNLTDGTSEKASALSIHPGNKVVSRIARMPVELKSPVSCHYLPASTEWQPFLLDEKQRGCGIYRRFGNGRIVLYLTSASLWQNRYLGFTAGLDGAFRNSIIWAAKKPYITKEMPPFVTARVDDVSFSGSPVALYPETVEKGRWLDIMNRFGFIPNAGVFIDDVKKQDVPKIKKKHREELAEFSPHAFKDPKNINEFPIYMKHNGEEFPDDVLRDNFEKVDKRFLKWGIEPSKPVNVHFGEIGLKALPYLKARGERYLTNPIGVGKAFADPSAHSWDIAPYGNPMYCFGYIPEDSDFFNVSSHPGTLDDKVPDQDFMFGCTTFWKENPSVDIKKAIERGVFQVTRGIENGFFGCLSTHEQRPSHLTPAQWEEIMRGISLEIRDIPHTFKSYGYISRYAENRTFYEIENAECDREIIVRLRGRNTMDQLLHLFIEENGDTVESYINLPAFEKSIVLHLPFRG